LNAVSALLSASEGDRCSARRKAAVTCASGSVASFATRAAKCLPIATVSLLLRIASAWSALTDSLRLSTDIEGSAQSSTVMNGCGCERTMNR
jgi:hypothetical protein